MTTYRDINNNTTVNENGKALRSQSATPTIAPAEGLELTQITHRIAALTFPTNGSDAVYRASIKEISEKLKRNFPDRYKIFNVSQKRSDLGRANGVGVVSELGWPNDLAPPLDRLCAICKQLENWLCENRQNIAIIHCKGWRSRAAVVVAAYMNYTNICTGGESTDDRFSMQLFSEKFLGVYGQPSHKRYVKYFASLLSGVSRVNAAEIFLQRIIFSCLFPDADVILKIYERMKPVYTSEPIRMKELTRLDLGTVLSLRGDIIFKCFTLPVEDYGARQLLFQCQFNTCASEFLPNKATPQEKALVCTGRLVFFKEEIDRIFADPNVDNQAAMELTFLMENPMTISGTVQTDAPVTPLRQRRVSKTPPKIVSAVAASTFARVDSYENFDKSEDERSLSQPAEGVGSLYTGLIKIKTTTGNNNHKPQILKRLKRNNDQQLQHQRRSMNELRRRDTERDKNDAPPSEFAAANIERPFSVALIGADSSGIDSGVGSDSPPRGNIASSTATNTPTTTFAETRRPLHGILKHRKTPDASSSIELEEMRKEPPKVPPKPMSRRSSYAAGDDYDYDDDDPMRTAYEDSTIGRDHSVLPAGLRPRPLPHQYRHRGIADGGGGEDGDSASTHDNDNAEEEEEPAGVKEEENGDEEDSERVQKERARRLAKILRIGPDLVGKDRYDPNSKCFSYVPAKSLKEHYRTTPRKLPARWMGATRSESNLSPEGGGEKTFEVMPKDLAHRVDTPKWENEIDKYAPKVVAQDSPPASHRRSVPPSEIARDHLSEPVPPPRLQQKREQVVPKLRPAANAMPSATDTIDAIAGKPPPETERPLRQRREQVARDLYNGSVTPSITHDLDTIAGPPPSEFQRPLRQRREQTARDLYDRNMTRSATNELDVIAGPPPSEVQKPLRQRREQTIHELRAANQTPTALADLDAIYGTVRADSPPSRHRWPTRQKREQEFRDLYNHSALPGAISEIDSIANGYLPQERYRAQSTLPSTTASRYWEPYQGASAGAIQDFEREEKPIVFDQARRAVTHTHSPTRSMSRLPSTAIQNNGMDAFLDPNFYLSGGNATQMASARSAPREKSLPASIRNNTLRDVSYKPLNKSVSQKELDDLNDLLNLTPSAAGAVSRESRFDAAAKNANRWEKPPTSAYAASVHDDFRDRNCRSVSAITYNRKPLWSATDSRDVDSDTNAKDDWLERKLRALQGKRANDFGVQNRRNTERILLEELKNVHASQAATNESNYKRQLIDAPEERPATATKAPHMDALRAANRLAVKEQIRRLANNDSINAARPISPPVGQRPTSQTPQFESGLRWQESPLARGSFVTPTPTSISHVLVGRPPAAQPKRGATPTSQIIRGKPPTPPPSGARHDRERSPALSPLASRRAPPTITATRSNNTTPKPDSNSHVSGSIAALRGSIYEAERNRINLNGNGVGPSDSYVPPYNTTPKRDIDADSSEGADVEDDDTETSGGEFGHLKRIVKVTPSSRDTTNSLSDYSSATKSILKQRTRPSAADTDESFTYTTPSRYAKHPTGAETPAEESSEAPAGSRAWNRNPNWYSRQTPTSALLVGDRAETPAFPLQSATPLHHPAMSAAASSGTATPLPYHCLLYRSETPAADFENGNGGVRHSNTFPSNAMVYRSGSPRSYYDQSRRSSMNSIDGAEVIHNHPVFVKDTSKYWYKPNISREEAINMLKEKPPGTFVVRDSNSFPGAFGLALKVARPPPNATQNGGDTSAELVRHFLIEPSPKGVKLKGCANEPVFGTLAALVYQHSIMPMALPCRLLLPEYDPALSANEQQQRLDSNQALLERGAACNVTYLGSIDTESLTGPEALRRAAAWGLEDLARGAMRAIPVHFKVSAQGITLTDNTRSQFFRRHYAAHLVTYAGIDPENRVFDNNNCCQLPPCYVLQAPIFGFVARKFVGGCVENACHVFAELDPDQPASAVVRFITNVMMPQAKNLQKPAHLNDQR